MWLNEASTSLHTQISLARRGLRVTLTLKVTGGGGGGQGRANAFPCKTSLFLPRVRKCREPSSGEGASDKLPVRKPALTLNRRNSGFVTYTLIVGVNSWLG